MASTLEPPTEKPEPVKKPEPEFDAKAYLERTLPRKPGDLLKVIAVHGRDAFRVNWYNNPAAQRGAIPGLNISYIRESKYLFCSLNAEGTPEIAYPAKQ